MPLPASSPTRTLAVARACRLDGCDVEPLAGGEVFPAAYSEPMVNRIKVRPGDLVAIDPTAEGGPAVVWRWWSGTVEVVAAGGGTVTVSRRVTRRAPDDPERRSGEVAVPEELVGTIEAGETVWFGSEDGTKVVVAVQGIG